MLDINDDPVTIKQIEQSIADRAWDEGWVKPEPPPFRTGRTRRRRRLGPRGHGRGRASSTSAGHTVTLFERQRPHRRPAALRRAGLQAREGRHPAPRRPDARPRGSRCAPASSVGVDITADELREQFDAVVLAIGSTIPRDLPVPGRELDGVHFAMEYLEQRNRFVAGEPGAGHADHRGRQARGDHRRRRHRRRLPRQLAPRGPGQSITQFELLPEPPPERPDDRHAVAAAGR